MDISMENVARATGSLATVGEDWMPATGTRSLILNDPVILWLQSGHGKQYGFVEDDTESSLFDFITAAGRDFESHWLRNEAPEAVQALRDDRDVRRVQGVLRTFELMQAQTPVITHAALWNARERIYGAADLIALESWIFQKWPHLRPRDWNAKDDCYCALDIKFSSDLEKGKKAKSFEIYSVQTRLYSYALGHMQGQIPPRAYLITRDRHNDPLPVEISSKLHKPLDKDLADLRDKYVDIKLNGGKYRPWCDKVVEANFNNSMDTPWSAAKERIAEEFLPGKPLQTLPRVGAPQAESLKALGFEHLGAMLKAEPEAIPLEDIDGVGPTTAKQIRAVLTANRSEMLPRVPASLVPRQSGKEAFVDFEFFPSLRIHYDTEPWSECLQGREMVFMVGVGVVEAGVWTYKQFVAEREDAEAERAMFHDFLHYLKTLGIIKQNHPGRLWHYSQAEVWQCKRRAEKLKIPELGQLPWSDLQTVVLSLPLGVPGSYSFGLKSIVKSLSKLAPEYAVHWPEELSSGSSATVRGWRMYENSKPFETEDFAILSQYLEIDCKSMERLLAWLRDSAEPAKAKRTASWWPRSLHLPLSRVRGGWYSEAAW